MTFEEFFIKKKIDLDQLKDAEPALFEEFKYDYAQMGEKSFDHTKKFWFNKLRKVYHLKPSEKPEAHKPGKNSLARQAEPLGSPTIVEKTLYSPRFKPGIASQPKPESIDEKEVKDSIPVDAVSADDFSQSSDSEEITVPKEETTGAEPSKPAYKPRFKARAIKDAQKNADETYLVGKGSVDTVDTPSCSNEEEEQAGIESEKPALREEPEDLAEQSPEEPKVKPAYKPRFKPGMVNKPKPKDEPGDSEG